jgi:chromosome segregation ATPase
VKVQGEITGSYNTIVGAKRNIPPSAAEVTVTIKNEGDAAHRPEVFGRKIIITRHFTEKSSSYKIRAHDGTLIGTKKTDVQAICDDLEIQVDNPLCILNQGKYITPHLFVTLLSHFGPSRCLSVRA